MSVGVSSSSLAHYQQASYENRSLQHATLRRKSAHLWDGAQGALSGYPSPPMSSPPSPTRRPSDLTLPSTTRSEQFLPVSTNPPLASSLAEHSSQQTSTPIASFGLTVPDVPAYHPTALFATGSGSAALGSTTSAYPPTSYAPPPTIHQRTISQDARKAKTHVASACVNCKRAHLSCDVQRPCARCIASGKQDTCYDVAHKKRGRPRLRDESQFGVERSMPSSNAPVTATMPMSTPTRPIAATRQRRAESFRSIHSMTSEESSSYGPPTPSFLPRPPVPFQTPLSFQSPAYQITSPPMEPEVPTALLDLDFIILRANASFQQIMADDRDLTRTRLHEIAAPADSESFMSIRTRLRGEREARQPSYLPPIVSSGEDPLGGVLDRDVESLTRGFSDYTYQWIQLKSGPRGAQTFPARVRLAKAATYFAVVSLPSFRPIERAPPPAPQQGASPYGFGPPLPSAEEAMMQRRRPSLTHSAPSSMFQPTEMAHPQPRHVHRRAPSFSRNFPPLQLQYPSQASHQHPQPQHFLSSQPIIGSSLEPRILPTEPGIHTASYGPPGMAAAQPGTHPAPPGLGSAPPRDVRLLPPIAPSPSQAITPPGPSSMPPLHEPTPTSTIGTRRRTSESDEDSESRRLQSPRKRRRMGIDEVLQK